MRRRRSAGSIAGERWQCVELVNRLYLTRGWIRPAWIGDGGRLFATAPANLTKEANGSITSVSPGDVVSIRERHNGKARPYGHVAVINTSGTVTSGTIPLVNQNGGSKRNVIVTSYATLANGTLTLAGGRGGRTRSSASSRAVQRSVELIGVTQAHSAVGSGPWSIREPADKRRPWPSELRVRLRAVTVGGLVSLAADSPGTGLLVGGATWALAFRHGALVPAGPTWRRRTSWPRHFRRWWRSLSTCGDRTQPRSSRLAGRIREDRDEERGTTLKRHRQGTTSGVAGLRPVARRRSWAHRAGRRHIDG